MYHYICNIAILNCICITSMLCCSRCSSSCRLAPQYVAFSSTDDLPWGAQRVNLSVHVTAWVFVRVISTNYKCVIFLSHFQLERPHLVHQPSSETRKSDLVRQWSSSQDSTNWTERQRSFSSSSEMTIMSNNSIQKPAQICTTVTQPSTTGYLPLQTTYTQQATGITTTATAVTPTSKVQQPFSSEACSVSNLQLVCEVHNATTGSIIRGATTTVHPIKKKYSSVPPGTPLCVQVKANRGCYIYIINIGSSGKVSTLIPNEYEPQNYLTPDATLVFPSKEADYEFELDSHSGEETLVLLAYSTQCNIDQAERDCLRLKKYAISDQHNFLGSLEVQFSVK